MNSVEISGLVIAFGGFRAVDGISFTVGKGEIFGFLGANGAGKTTTIRALCGLLTPTAGSISVAGIAPGGASDTALLKTRIGYMSQRFTLYNDLTVLENLEFAAALRKLPPDYFRARMKELLDFTGFDYPADTPVKSLPGGVKQQMALAAATLHDPEVVFLDEPTAGVSPSARKLFWNLIRRLAAAGKTIFVTTHYMDEAEQCGRIALMQSGKIVALDSPAGLKSSYFPEPLYELDVPAATAALIKQSGSGTISPCGMRYHLAVRDAAKWENFKAGLPVKITERRIAPSLEDVFLRAVGGGT